jgi:hypothetical protein
VSRLFLEATPKSGPGGEAAVDHPSGNGTSAVQRGAHGGAMTNASTILVDPSAEGLPDFRPIAERLKDLTGRRIGLLDNIKHNGEYLLAGLAEALQREYGCEIRTVRKRTYTRPAEDHVLAALEGCEAVITAIGD